MRNSLSSRLTYRIMAVVLVMMVIIAGVVYFSVREYMLEEAKERYTQWTVPTTRMKNAPLSWRSAFSFYFTSKTIFLRFPFGRTAKCTHTVEPRTSMIISS